MNSEFSHESRIGFQSMQGDSTHRINRKPSSRNDGVSEKINVESSDVRQSHGGFVENNLPSLGTNLPLKLPPRPPRRQKRTNKTKNVTSPVEGVQSPTASSSDGQMKRGNSTISALIRSPRKRSKKSTSNPPHVEVNENHGLVMSPFHPSRMTRTIAEHDAVNENNILEVHQYATDIYQRLYETESRYQISCWTGRQPWMSQELRYKTVDWMCRMHGRLKLQPETLYLGVQLFDRFCSKVAVHENNLFLISSTALFIAWKYEETEAPTVKAFKFSKDEVVAMERKMLEILEFRISAPTGHAFLRRFLFICNASRLTSYTASYYLERCLPVEDALRVRPSLMAAAAVCLALGHPFLEQTYNPEQMVRAFGSHKRLDLLDCSQLFFIYRNRLDKTAGGLHWFLSKRTKGGFAADRCRI